MYLCIICPPPPNPRLLLRFSFPLVPSSFTVIYLGVDLFLLSLFGVHRASQTFGLVLSISSALGPKTAKAVGEELLGPTEGTHGVTRVINGDGDNDSYKFSCTVPNIASLFILTTALPRSRPFWFSDEGIKATRG